MELKDINPFMRYMDKRVCSINYDKPILAYDYRLFFVIEGTCCAETSAGTLQLEKHSAILIPPAHPYRLLFPQTAQLYDVNFSLNYVPCGSLAPEEAGVFNPTQMPEQPDDQLFSEPMAVYGIPELMTPLGELLTQHERGGIYGSELCAAMLKCILIQLMRRMNVCGGGSSPLLEALQAYLDEHCRESLTAEQIGNFFGYHPFHLNRLLREQTGWTIHRYQMECRIKRACSMLDNTHLSIREISDSLGFSRSAYFSELFGRMRGMSPTEYRRRKA